MNTLEKIKESIVRRFPDSRNVTIKVTQYGMEVDTHYEIGFKQVADKTLSGEIIGKIEGVE